MVGSHYVSRNRPTERPKPKRPFCNFFLLAFYFNMSLLRKDEPIVACGSGTRYADLLGRRGAMGGRSTGEQDLLNRLPSNHLDAMKRHLVRRGVITLFSASLHHEYPREERADGPPLFASFSRVSSPSSSVGVVCLFRLSRSRGTSNPV